jgi:cell division septation protein DedD
MKKSPHKKASTKSKKKYLLQLTSKGFLLGLCQLFLISGWMFVLGVLVGRGTAPVNFDIQALQNELKQLKTSMMNQERRAMESDSAKAGAKAAFEFYEALKKKEQTEAFNVPEKKEASQTPRSSTLVSQKRISKSNEIGKPKRDLPKIKPQPAGTIAVQVASTKDEASATTLVKKIKQLGYAGFSVRAVIPEKGIWYRVRVGPYRTKAQAEQMRKELLKDGFKGIVVKN